MSQQVGAHDRPNDDLLQAPHHSTTPLLNYGPDESSVPPVPAATAVPSLNRAEFGHFNEARLLAIAACPASDDDNGRSSSRAPVPPQPFFTNANTQPLGTRGASRELSTEIGQKRKSPDSPVSNDTASDKRIKEEGFW